MPPRQKATAPPEDAGLINIRQMRQLHALLRDHGITGDSAIHSYLAMALTELGEPAVESRSDLTTVQAAHLIADLEAADVSEAPSLNKRMLTKLRAEFPADEVGKLPRSTCKDCSRSERKRCEQHRWVTGCPECRGSHSSATMHIDYVGHADVTARLLEVDPAWSWRPFSVDEINAMPPGYRAGLWIWLQVGGVERPGFGHADNDRQTGGDAVKVAIGDALRNAAMRFGVALDLWAKGDRAWADAAKQEAELNPSMDPPPPQQQTPPEARPYAGPTTPELLAMIDGHAERAGTTREAMTAKFREANGNVPVEALESMDPQMILGLEQSIADYLLKHPPTPAEV